MLQGLGRFQIYFCNAVFRFCFAMQILVYKGGNLADRKLPPLHVGLIDGPQGLLENNDTQFRARPGLL